MNKFNKFLVKNKKVINIYLLAIVFFLVDIVSKAIIMNKGNILYEKVVIQDFFYLNLTKNTGAAFSILPNATWFFVIIGILALIFIDRCLLKEAGTKLKDIAFSLLIGGIFGNLFDRIFNGYVIDFLDFRIFNYNFPVFNLADTFIVIGAILLIIDLIRSDLSENRSSRRK